MYTAAKLTHASIRALMELQNQGANHSRAFNLAVAYVFSNKLPTPTTGSDDAVGYYRMHHAIEVRSKLSSVNELMPFDMRTSEDDIKAFFQFRVNMINAPEIPLAINPETSLIDFFTLSSCFSKEALAVISNEGPKLTSLIARLTPIYADLCKCDLQGSSEVDPMSEQVPG